ncbi:YceI family protein [Bacteroidia bacterium]|nr:YceI family protein [Bacteroidia bacterium]
MKNIKITLALGLMTIAAIAATTWKPTTGSVKFYIKNTGITVDGEFSGITASIKFDENDLANSSIFASVKASTVNTGIDKRDEHLRKAEYFDVANYPKITLKSTSIVKVEKGYVGTFDVTIKGKKKSLKMPFTFDNKGETGTFSGTLKLDRLDFDVGESSFILSDDVKVKIILNVKN